MEAVEVVQGGDAFARSGCIMECDFHSIEAIGLLRADAALQRVRQPPPAAWCPCRAPQHLLPRSVILTASKVHSLVLSFGKLFGNNTHSQLFNCARSANDSGTSADMLWSHVQPAEQPP